jgi:hypothetical protein
MFAEKGLRLCDPRTIYFVRHLLTFALFAGAVFVFYRLLRRRLPRTWLPLAGTLFLILSPRIYADAFYNSKDLAFLSLFVFGLASLDAFRRRPSWRTALVHALTCAACIDVRMPGLVLPEITLLLAFADWYLARREGRPYWPGRRNLALYGGFLAVFVLLLWPVLWLNPPYHFYKAFMQMRRFGWDQSVLYLGELVAAKHLPWHYIPVWILLSTPPLYTLLFGAGAVPLLAAGLRRPLRTAARSPLDTAMALAFFLPLGSVIVLRSTLYDGWRHLYFVYPPFVYLATLGLARAVGLARRVRPWFRPAPWLVAGATALGVGGTVLTMVRLHPYENLYFNRLAGRTLADVKNRFETDYWGLSVRAGLEYIAAHDAAPDIWVTPSHGPFVDNRLLLPAADRARLHFTDDKGRAHYLMSFVRSHREECPPDGEAFAVEREGAKILVVYKLR